MHAPIAFSELAPGKWFYYKNHAFKKCEHQTDRAILITPQGLEKIIGFSPWKTVTPVED